ncbi:axonemal dynein light chain domain-containing protein 1 isoform X4 [Varanus komodoensis]|uniref:axonemal dynein light chain domain-containing protein 1 isoform X4 n=1 Tax=Varanus komodoensis TaxID=61221 RepID=UPI001CF7C0D7|nr:axonemal dynein light chain domain-containing protein 1 isoform X4 [Varanus komodoensis]
MSANKEQIPVLPSTSKQEIRKPKDTSIVPAGKGNKELPELRGRPGVVNHSNPLSTSLQRDFIPEEIFVALTSAAKPVPCPAFLRPPRKKSTKDFQGCIRTADGVWQHPVRRNKFRYLIEHPICLTGAGRDVSFLYDVAAVKEAKNPPPTPVPHKTSKDSEQDPDAAKLPASVADSLVPEEFHIVKNRAVLGLEYYDDKYTTLLEDEQNRLRVFPSMKPSGRLEVLQLMKVMDSMLERAGVDNEEVGVSGLSQMHNVLEVLKVEQNIYNIVFHEIIRQVSVDCAERGELLSKLRQRYVELLERIPRQMRTLYKEMMAQRVMDKHITDELFYFKEAIGQLTRELNTIREHDRRATVEAEKAYEELEKAVRDSEMNANLLDEYRELYELQRARLEGQIHQLTQEKELWSNTAYDLAYKDALDLSTLQQLTQEFRELLSQIGTEVGQAEAMSRERAGRIQDGLTGWLNYFYNHVLGKGKYTPAKGIDLLDQILADLKVWEKILNEELAQYGGDVLLVRQEPLQTAAKLQKQWVELGLGVLARHKDLHGKMPSQLKMLEEVNKNSNRLCEQYRIRIHGENGSARILISLINSLEDWSFKLLTSKQKSAMLEAEWIKFFQAVSDWLAQIDDLLKFIGTVETPEERKHKTFTTNPVVPENLFKKIQQWILTTTNCSEKEHVQLTVESTDLHNTLNKWMANLLIHLVPDYTSSETLPLTDAETARQAEQKIFNMFNLEGEGMGLAAKLSKFSCYMVSCCKEMVASITRKQMAALEPDADYELQELEKVKTECLDWIETCTLLISAMKSSPTTLISKDELVNLFGSEALQPQRKLPPRPGHDMKTSSLAQSSGVLEEEEAAAKKEATVEMEKEVPALGTVTEEKTGGPEIAYPVRYIGDDWNVHVKSMSAEEVTVSGRELYAGKWTTAYSKKEFEMLASLEILEERLLEAEKRAQQAEEKSEILHEELEQALSKINDLEGEAPALKTAAKTPESEPEASEKKPGATSPPTSTKTSTPRTKKSGKLKR